LFIGPTILLLTPQVIKTQLAANKGSLHQRRFRDSPLFKLGAGATLIESPEVEFALVC
jgi:hypothetical protein